MSLQGDFSSGTPGSVPPAGAPPPAAPVRSGRPPWLIPVIIGVVLCCALACGALALSMGPAITQATTLATMCVTANPDATQADCQAWVTDILQNHPDDYTACQQSSGGDQDALYQCLLDAGVSAP
jgi:hypothetical protein